MTRFILGIDGGGTKTQAAIVDETGRLRGVGVGGPANYDAVGISAAQANVERAVALARKAANLADSPFDAVFLGIAGVVAPRDHEIVQAMAHPLRLTDQEHIGIDHDCRIALAGGLSGRPGIVLIVGTGSSCFGSNERGEQWRAGGWGHLISDEGSSYWLAVQAMRMAVAAYDGRGEPTALVERVQRHFGLSDMNDLSHRLYVPGLSKPEVAALAPLVTEAAREGDQIALALIRQGANDLADCVRAVAKHLQLDDAPFELTLVGGLLRAGDVFVQLLRESVLAKAPRCQIVWPELPPILGACLLGLQMSGVATQGSVGARLREGAQLLEDKNNFGETHDAKNSIERHVGL